LGATTSIFPSDEITREFMKAQGRENDWIELKPDADAVYEEEISIDLSSLSPMAAQPHSPDRVETIKNIGKIKVDQVAIGSCTNSSFMDMMKVAKILKGKTVHEDVSLVIAPGSKQVLTMLAENGALADMVASGARILESSCGPCIGMGQSPKTDAISLRTFNRNFEGRSGTKSAQVYLVSPETAAVSALTGVLTDPREYGDAPVVSQPEEFLINDNLVIPPAPEGSDVEVVRGPNIQPFPINTEMTDTVTGKALIKVEDNITTDHIMPSNAKLLPYRSNIPYLSNYCLTPCDEEFPARAKANNGGFIIAGSNYGQGSSREHAALVPLYLGIKGVIAKSFARIHMANLINSGIIPMTFVNEDDYDKIDRDDELLINEAISQIENGEIVTVKNVTKNFVFNVNVSVSERQKQMLLAGGLLNFTKNSVSK
ncbi:MAG: aconitate hydratase, partial [Oscillospiraceae bacterium]|nr:aconitate hydratase [Oscillospiraceae bacterium]